MEKTHIQIQVSVKKELEILKKKYDLVSLSAVIKRLLVETKRIKGVK